MKKYLLCLFGVAALFAGCNEDRLVDSESASLPFSTSAGVRQAESGGIPGVAYIKVKSVLQKEMLTTTQGISLNNLPPAMAVTLKEVKASSLKRLFAPDPRFEKRMHREELDRWYVVNFDIRQDLEQTLATLAANPDFEVVEKVYQQSFPDSKTCFDEVNPVSTKAEEQMPFDDPELRKQWHYRNFGWTPKSVEGADINLFEAWKETAGTSNVIVSVVDGGIDITHEDLRDNLWMNTKEIPGNRIDDDGNGFVDDVYGYNFVSGKGEITLDDAGHGTHVSGTVAARNNNGIGVCGVAGGDGTPNSGARLMSCQIFEGSGGGGEGAKAIVYGANNGAVISQNSWGYNYPGPGSLPSSMRAAIDYFIKYAGCDNEGEQLPGSPMKGGVVIFAAGNDDKDYLSYPSAYPPVVAVSAMAPNWKKAWYTNRGDWVDIMAPGGDEYFPKGMVYSTVPPSIYNGSKYGYMQGTSMACPHVSGIAALIVSKFGGSGFTNEELKSRLTTSLRPENIDEHNPDYVGRLGAGYIDAALTFATNHNQSPEAVTDLTAKESFTSLTLQWTAVKDPDDGTPVKYLVYFSDQPMTASDYKTLTPYTINAYGYKPGGEMSYEIEGLKENTLYYAAVISVDRWGLESAFAVHEFKTLKNNPPVIEGVPESPVRVSGADIRKFTLKLSDPDGQQVTYALKGETRGVSASRAGDDLNFSIRAVAPLGKYEIEVIVTDELGASASAKIQFEVFVYKAPFVSKNIANMLIGLDQGTQQIDLNTYFTYQEGDKVTFEAKSSNSGVVDVGVNETTLSLKGIKPGTANVVASISNGKDVAKTTFQVRVVADSKDMVYQVYPIPATTELNVLVNPEMKQADFVIRSVNGEQVFRKSHNISSSSLVKLNIRNLSAGVYTLTVDGNKGSYKKTFVKQ